MQDGLPTVEGRRRVTAGATSGVDEGRPDAVDRLGWVQVGDDLRLAEEVDDRMVVVVDPLVAVGRGRGRRGRYRGRNWRKKGRRFDGSCRRT